MSSCRATNAKPLDMRKAANEKLNAAIARADAAEKRVAELKAQWTDILRDANYAAGIREGLERAAASLEQEYAFQVVADRVRSMKAEVK